MIEPSTQETIAGFGVEEYGEPLFIPDADRRRGPRSLTVPSGNSSAARQPAAPHQSSDRANSWFLIQKSCRSRCYPLRISATATAISLLLGLPLGTLLGLGDFRGGVRFS